MNAPSRFVWSLKICACVPVLITPATTVSAWQMKQAPLMTRRAALADTNRPLPESPRPQMIRTDWLNLNGLWRYQPGATNGQLYVDGTLVASQNVTTAPPGDDLDVWIGGSPDYGTERLVNAKIAHAAIFAQALTAAQVQDLYAGICAGRVSLSVARFGSSVVLTWQAGSLLAAPTVWGPWVTNGAAGSPCAVPVTNVSQFFKVLVNPWNRGVAE